VPLALLEGAQRQPETGLVHLQRDLVATGATGVSSRVDTGGDRPRGGQQRAQRGLPATGSLAARLFQHGSRVLAVVA
jgi:hypothetical protein